MPSLANLMEDYRNWRGRQEWEQGKGWQDFFGGDPRAQEQFEKLSGFGTDAGGLVGMIKASHGSPHAFDRFDFSKIGTGEGAQAYGHGLYFGEGFDSPVAQSYRTAGVPASEYQDKIFLKQYHADNAKLRGDKEGEERALAALAELKENPPGHMYNAELRWPDAAREASDPLGEHHLLDWDAPLSEQPESVRSKLLDVMRKRGLPVDESNMPLWASSDPTGEAMYAAFNPATAKNNRHAQELASQLMRETGIPGIRYLDQASRGAGSGTRNYVMFDDQIPNIVSRNGASLSDLLDTSYQSGHTAPGPDFGAQLHDLTGGGQMYPDDIYSANAARFYGHGGRETAAMDKKAVSLIHMLRNKPEELVDIYRAVPKDENIESINPGDWVTITPDYAKYHGEGPLGGDYKILKQKVPAKSIWTNADSIHEYGYWPDQ